MNSDLFVEWCYPLHKAIIIFIKSFYLFLFFNTKLKNRQSSLKNCRAGNCDQYSHRGNYNFFIFATVVKSGQVHLMSTKDNTFQKFHLLLLKCDLQIFLISNPLLVNGCGSQWLYWSMLQYHGKDHEGDL